MKTALFLGAGASAFASQPTTKEIMERLRDHVGEHIDEIVLDKDLQKYITSVVEAHTKHVSYTHNRIVESYAYRDVEELYDGIEQIINITTNRNCEPIINNMPDHKYNIANGRIIAGLVDLRSTIRKILRASFVIDMDTHKSIKQLYNMIWSVMKNYGTEDLRVFTTNYDLVMETYAQEAGLEIINGFEPYRHLSKAWNNMWDRGTKQPPLYLTKMHGSIYWHRDGNGKIVETGSVADMAADSDIMIAPTMGAKDYNREPFSNLIDHFKMQMKGVDVLLVIGFSYRDNEIVNIITNELENELSLISISPNADTSICRVSDAKIQTATINGKRLKVVGPRIVLCNEKFDPDAISEMRAVLDAAYTYILPSVRREHDSRARRK